MTTARHASAAPATTGAAGRAPTPPGALTALTKPALVNAIDEYRRIRHSQIHALISTGSATVSNAPRNLHESGGDLALGYAMAHHILEGAHRAAEARDTTSLDWYRRALPQITALASPTPTGPTIILNPPADELLRSPTISDTSYYLINAASRRAGDIDRGHVADAIALARRHGFTALVGSSATVICLLARRDLLDTLHSWTISALPGTVFTDHTGHPEILARDLVHEAGHNWLNDALVATGTRTPESTVFSPWRDAMRPAFGFLHACWAFPLTMIYAKAALPESRGPVQNLLIRYLETQRPLLRAAQDDFTHLVRDIDNDDLTSTLTTVFDSALDLR
ncbi:MAG: aKG-HExxH-type peptide beta-hydroxylase [Dermatophilaceae bacterium]